MAVSVLPTSYFHCILTQPQTRVRRHALTKQHKQERIRTHQRCLRCNRVHRTKRRAIVCGKNPFLHMRNFATAPKIKFDGRYVTTRLEVSLWRDCSHRRHFEYVPDKTGTNFTIPLKASFIFLFHHITKFATLREMIWCCTDVKVSASISNFHPRYHDEFPW